MRRKFFAVGIVFGVALGGWWWLRTGPAETGAAKPKDEPAARQTVTVPARAKTPGGLVKVPAKSSVPAPASAPLWAAPSETRGEKLDPKSASYAQAQRNGEKPTGRSSPFDPGSVASLAALQRGDSVVFPLLGGERVTGKVNLVQREADGWVRVGGELTGPRSGSFALGSSGKKISGTILLPQEEIAYAITEQPNGQMLMEEKLLSDVICFPYPRSSEEPNAAPPIPTPQAAPPILSSRPSVTAVLYLDFDGETVTEPTWNNGNTIVAQPSSLSTAGITEVWNRVKEDFWPFNIDVTTDVSRYNNAPVGKRMRCIITPTDTAAPGAGGVAKFYIFDQAGQGQYSTTIPCWVFNSSVVGVAEAVSHEFGHTLGLHHDGRTSPVETYYEGHGSGAVGWAPIMGASYYESLTQWSKGEYANANNQEDDLAIIANAANGFGYVADEAGNSLGSAAALNVPGGAVNQTGIISGNNDVDYYFFTVGSAATVSLTASPASISPNLDILLELRDSAGNLLTSSNPDTALNATVSYSPAPGRYYIKIQGTGRGDVLGDGYSSYGSIGHYSLTGSIVNLALPPTITQQPTNVTVTVGATAIFSVTATGTAPLSYQWRKNGVNTASATNATLTLSNVQTNQAGNYTVVITNLAGSVTSSVAVLTVNRLSQTIAFGALPAKRVDDAPFNLSATASSGLTVSYTSSNPGVATVSGNTVTITGVGSTTITASQAGNATYLPATSVSRTLTVSGIPGTVVAWGYNANGQTSIPAGLSGVTAIAAGAYHTVVLRSNSTVTAWGAVGELDFGQTNPPAGLSGVTAIAAGAYHTVVLKTNGTVVAWGDNSTGETDVPAGLSGVTAIAAGAYHTVVLKTNGTVIAWGAGAFNFGQTNTPAGLSGVMAIAAGDSHTVALKSDGTVIAWGYNDYGQTTIPVGLTGVMAIAAGGYNTVALKTNGTVVAWGDNRWGQTNTPAGLSGVMAIAAGGLHTVALKTNGTVVAWGSNTYGQTNVPAGLSRVTAIAAGGFHNVAIILAPFISTQPQNLAVNVTSNATFSVTATGDALLSYQWRKNGVNVSGGTNATLTLNNVQTNQAGNYTVVITNAYGSVTSSVAVLTVNRLVQTVNIGSLPDKQAGDAPFTLSATASSGLPVSYTSSNPGVATVSGNTVTITGLGTTTITGTQAGNATYLPTSVSLTFRVVVAGRVVAWGAGTTQGAFPEYGQSIVPIGLSGVTAIAAGQYHTVALRTNGTVIAWGDNATGETDVPAGLSGVTAIAAGAYHTVVLKTNGTVTAWGAVGFDFGQTNPPAGLSGVTAIAAGVYHTVALKADGTVVAWGAGKTNLGADPHYGQSIIPAGLSGVTAIAAGGYHTVALKSDGTLVTWGHNGSGQTNVPTGLNGVTAIAAGYEHTVALKSNGTVVTWGYNGSGLTNVPPGLNGVTAIAAGYLHTAVLKTNGTVIAWGYNRDGATNVPAGLSEATAIAGGGWHTVAIVSTEAVGPALTAIATGNNLTLLWPDTPVGYRVESTLSLSPPVTWTNVAGSFQTNGGSISMVLSNAGGKKFYRLAKP